MVYYLLNYLASKRQKEKPHHFHNERPGPLDEHKIRHFKEHVVDAIPFHEKFLKDHEKRLETILSMVPKNTYIKLVRLTRKHHGLPEYFVYDKKNKMFFFVAEHATGEQKEWIRLVKDRHKLCEVIVLN